MRSRYVNVDLRKETDTNEWSYHATPHTREYNRTVASIRNARTKLDPIIGEEVFYERPESKDWEEIMNDFNIAMNIANNILTLRQRDVVMRYYGIRQYSRHTLEEIGAIYKLSRERIRQMIARSLLKLQAEMHEYALMCEALSC